MKKITNILMYAVLILSLLIPNYAFAESTDAFTLVKMKSISGGEFCSAAVDVDGNVWTWGGNNFGQLGDGSYYSRSIPSKVEGLSGFKSVSCGANHVLALKEDGTVWAWGLNMHRQLGSSTSNFSQNTPVEVIGLNDVKAVAGGANHSVALKNDGTVWTWGENSEGQLGRKTDKFYSDIPEAVEGLVDIVSLAVFKDYTAALKEDGTVWICRQVYGNFKTVVQVEGLDHVKSISTLFNNIVALKDNGYVVLLRDTANGGNIKYLKGFYDVVSISCSQYQIAALKRDGTLWISGKMYETSSSLLGTQDSNDLDNPTQVTDITDIDVMASGYNHILFLKKDGTVWGMGNNQYGQLGNGVAISRNIPVKVKGLRNVRNIDANGYYHSMALINDGSIRVWGNEVKSHIDGEFSSIPKVVPGINNVVSITGNYTNYAVLKEDGTVWNWGPDDNEPTEVKKLDGVTDISGGNDVSFQFAARKTDGTVWKFSKSPYMVEGLINIIAISEGRNQTLALKEDGTVWSFNSNGKKPIKVPDISDVIAISTGDNMSLALKDDGTVWTWSINGDANLQSCQPVKIEGLSDIIAISGADTALKSDGTVWKWGKNNYGQIGNGTMEDTVIPVKVIGLEGIVKISSNEWHSLALDKNGEVWAWGRNNGGQLGDGAVLYENKPVQCMFYSKPQSDEVTDIIKVTVNNDLLAFDVLPINVNSRILVPMRLIFESLGAEIEWDESTLTVTAKKDGNTMKIRTGSTEAFINGQKVLLDTPANLYGGRMLVPVRFISESLGAKVDWDSYSRTVIIKSN